MKESYREGVANHPGPESCWPMPCKLWGRPPGLRGTPSSRCWHNGVSTFESASGPTRASGAVQGDRPTMNAPALWAASSRCSWVHLFRGHYTSVAEFGVQSENYGATYALL